MNTLEQEITRASQQNQPLCIALCEIDSLEQVNETYGAIAADYLLRRVKQHISSELRSFDTVGHSGKDEILLIFNCSEEIAKRIFERIRLSISNTPFYYEHSIIQITISCGLTVYTPPVDARNSQVLIETADRALYSAKDKGRNAVVCLSA